MNVTLQRFTLAALFSGLIGLPIAVSPVQAQEKFDPVKTTLDAIAKLNVGTHDWPQWAGSNFRNNTPEGTNIPDSWDIDAGTNIKWQAKLGSQTYGNPIVANGKIFIGTNNGGGWLKRYPSSVDLGCLLCFDEATGEFLWQHSSPKLPTGRVHDWPLQGICCSAFAEGDRVWFVTSRGEVQCLDPEGFHDGKNNPPYTNETNENKDEADIIWKYDMMQELGISQHNMCSCSLTTIDDTLLICTSNGVDESHFTIPAPNAPSFIALDKNTGKLLWTDKHPGERILHGQWSSPAVGVFDGQAQVLFAGGDAWLYSFDPAGDGNGNAKLLWKFDCNPKESRYILGSGGRGKRNEIIGTPVIYNDLVYLAVGQDPEHGEGDGLMWCIDPTRYKGVEPGKDGDVDVSPTLAVDKDDNLIDVTAVERRLQIVVPENGEKEITNPNSAMVWKYTEHDLNNNNKIEFEEKLHRTIGTVTIKDDLLYLADFSGLVHCVDATTGTLLWSHDMFAASWGSPLVVDGKVYIGDEDGDVTIFEHGKTLNIISEINMGNSVYSTPIVANNVLYISNKSTLFAITEGGK
ncbi:MAG: PQQ-binding-like beta-propeller repeat protein [Planctomycetota bacterium]|nr:PQQ-binding-like beta-propeller repeat protein [Planctomycetota bacterium]MDA1211198.1 PQQ-binding-like beta-propeller repeat protein [Planctomycetota bacterium]